MNFIAGVKTFIFILSSCILYPVLILLAGLAVWIFYECGTLFADWIRRKKLPEGSEHPAVADYREKLETLLSGKYIEADIQNLLRKSIEKLYAQLDKFRITIRIAPALGLIGTLVPMGTALASLGQGDFSVMTSELVLAYTTTVVGLLISSLAYLINTIRRRFAEQDIREMEYLTERRFHEIHA